MSIQEILNDKEKIRMITKAAFDQLDVRKAGALDKNDMEAHLINISKDLNMKKPTKEELDGLMKELDKKKDGKLDMEEFEYLVEEIMNCMAESLENGN
jgi:Ca2+-binding EF-hand superfamily protein